MGLRLAQTAFSAGELGEELWARADLEKYGFGLRTGKNGVIRRSGSFLSRPGTVFVGEVRDSSDETRIVPFQFNTSQAYIIELGDAIMRPIMDQGQVLATAVAISDVTQASLGVVTAVGHGRSIGDHVFIASVGGMTELNNRSFIVNTVPTADTLTLTDMYGTALNTSALTAYTSGGTISWKYQLSVPFAKADLFSLYYTQTADTMYLTHLGYAVRKLTRTAHSAWSITSVTFGPSQTPPTSPTVSATTTTNVTALTTYSYKITAIDEDTGEESTATSATVTCTNDLSIAGTKNVLTWSSATNAERYIVYKNDNGVFGFIGGTTALTFTDNNISPDLGDTPPQARNPFSAASAYPAVCEFHEGRLWFAQTINNPGGVWASASNLYENMNVSSPAKADDSVSFRLRPGVNAVVGLASSNKLIALTKDAEFTVEGGGVTQFITPSSLVVKRQSARGAAALRPLIIGDVTLYAQRQGTVIRAFGYSFEKDGYRSNDLTLLAPHLFEGHSIVDWCYQQDPHSIVWCVRDDGVLLALTFVEDQNVFAWTRCYLGGSFSTTDWGVVESIATIEGDTEDEVYLLVKRTINSATKRYVEMLVPRWQAEVDDDGEITNLASAKFVDCHVSVTNSPASATVSGLHHLEGQSVSGLADGVAFSGKTVSGGAITLSAAASTIQVGLPYVTDVEPLPVSQGTDRGASQGRRKKITSVVAKIRNTMGISYGNPEDTALLTDLRADDLEDWDGELPVTGDTRPLKPDGRWGMDGRVLFRQAQPYPFELLGIYAEPAVSE